MKFSVKRRPRIINGKPLIVIRPKDPTLALQLANLAIKTNDVDLFESLPEKVEDYIEIGLLAEGGKGEIINDNGRVIDKCKSGDSFVTRKG
jgi:hypothetical protein